MFSNFDETKENELGKLKHTTKESCDDCGRGKLQLRIRTVEGKLSEYLYCPNCGFEKRPKRSKAEGIWKKQVAKMDEVVEEVKPEKKKWDNSRYVKPKGDFRNGKN